MYVYVSVLTWICFLFFFLFSVLTDSGYTRKYQAYVKEKFSNLWFEESITRIYDHLEKELTQKECDNLEFLFFPKKIGKRKLEEFKGLGRQRSSSS